MFNSYSHLSIRSTLFEHLKRITLVNIKLYNINTYRSYNNAKKTLFVEVGIEIV